MYGDSMFNQEYIKTILHELNELDEILPEEILSVMHTVAEDNNLQYNPFKMRNGDNTYTRRKIAHGKIYRNDFNKYCVMQLTEFLTFLINHPEWSDNILAKEDNSLEEWIQICEEECGFDLDDLFEEEESKYKDLLIFDDSDCKIPKLLPLEELMKED